MSGFNRKERKGREGRFCRGGAKSGKIMNRIKQRSMNPRISPTHLPFDTLMAGCALFLLPFGALGAPPEIALVNGVIDGAPYQIGIPSERNGNLLIHAHGYRAEDVPLDSSLDLEDTAHLELLTRGWIVAVSAYRRNGIIVHDAVEDLLSLRDLLEAEYGPFSIVILEGQSMGGLVVSHLAEQAPDRFSGALAIGAALDIEEPGQTLSLTHRPEIPILFLSNRSEIAAPQSYLEGADGAPISPALWQVGRDGHVNVNKRERLLALAGLVGWITTGAIERNRDITVLIEAKDSEVTFDPGGANGRVIDITHNFGNLFIDVNESHFERLGIDPGDDFRLTIGDTTVTIRYGTTFSDVAKGEWISFPTAEGDTIVAISFGSAFDHLKPKIGDSVRIEAIAVAPRKD